MIPLTALVVMALIYSVNRYGHPIRAAGVFAALTAIPGALGLFGGAPVTAILLNTAVAFAAASAVFWLIDSVQGLFLGVVVTILGASALIALAWFA
jgi:hypothetical protein